MYPSKPGPRTSLLEAILFGPSESIVASEKRGQAQLVQSEVLPIDCGPDRAVFEVMGIVFGQPADDLFVFVTLPTGWRKLATSHDMWSDLLDDKGRKRAGIFYKAAFHDRSAHMHPVRFFNHRTEPVSGWDDRKNSKWQCRVHDPEGGVYWESEIVGPEPEYNLESQRETWLAWSNRKEALATAAVAWLDKNLPEWKNPLAYWDKY